MSFNVPVKALNPVDIKLPDHVVKGAVTIDSSISEWNNSVTFDNLTPDAAFITIDKSKNNLPEVIANVSSELKLPIGEDYALAFEDPRYFLTSTNIDKVVHGFMLTITASPIHYANRLKSVLTSNDSKKCDWAITKLVNLAKDQCFIEAFYETSSITLLYELLKSERIKSSTSMLCNLLHAVRSMLDLNVNNINWTAVPQELIDQLANYVTGGAKLEDASTVVIALQMIENLVNCEDEQIRRNVLSAVKVEALIRHLEKSDERVNLAALSVMNALHKNSDEAGRREIVKHLSSKPFRAAIAGSVLRTGRARERSLIDQLLPLQRLILEEQSEHMKTECKEEDLKKLLESEVLQFSDCKAEGDVELLKSSGLGKLAHGVLSRYFENYEEDIKILLSENGMRVEGNGWQFVPLCIQCLTIVCELLSVIPTEDNCVEQLIELLYTLDNPIDSFFHLVVQLFHRTWREMQASQGEAPKVGKVVREQLWRNVELRPTTLASLNDSLHNLSYWKIRKLWEKDEMTKENNQLSSEIVNELRRLLTPSIESLVIQNRKNFMKEGFTFKRVVKGKSALKDQYWFWKLDQAEKVITMTETDSDPYIEGLSHIGNVRKVPIKEIVDVPWGNDGTATLRKGVGASRGLRIRLKNDSIISVSASSDKLLLMWVDGLKHLIGKENLSLDANSLVDKLLNVELRLRLLDVPQPETDLPLPEVPSSLTWVIPHLDV
ncbi:unnamed protein product [Auanema sp. JU1783]|nr:unnamed protein product [Auanema sp. JU1783]